jgi:DNA-binding MarR family transcriptional regulator
MMISIGREVNIFVNRINRQVSNIVSKYGISGAQAHIINFIHNESKIRDLYQKDVEKEFDIRRASATNALQLLEKKGFITRVSVPVDARLKKIKLTERGSSIQIKVASIIIGSEQALREKLSNSEYAILLSIIKKLSKIQIQEHAK